MKEAENRFIRTEWMFGSAAMEKLAHSRVAVFGVGGVGGYVVEALARSGIGALDIIDNDVISVSNINRQILATDKTVDKYKVEVAAERIADINPLCKVAAHKVFYGKDKQALFDFRDFDYIVDAIDTVSSKLTIIENAKKCSTPIISSMGAGNKLDPTAFKVADIYKTSVCPLAKVMRKELRSRGIDSLKVVYSEEEPIKPVAIEAKTVSDISDSTHSRNRCVLSKRRRCPGSNAFVPPVVGLIIASEVIKDLILRK